MLVDDTIGKYRVIPKNTWSEENAEYLQRIVEENPELYEYVAEIIPTSWKDGPRTASLIVATAVGVIDAVKNGIESTLGQKIIKATCFGVAFAPIEIALDLTLYNNDQKKT